MIGKGHIIRSHSNLIILHRANINVGTEDIDVMSWWYLCWVQWNKGIDCVLNDDVGMNTDALETTQTEINDIFEADIVFKKTRVQQFTALSQKIIITNNKNGGSAYVNKPVCLNDVIVRPQKNVRN